MIKSAYFKPAFPQSDSRQVSLWHHLFIKPIGVNALNLDWTLHKMWKKKIPIGRPVDFNPISWMGNKLQSNHITLSHTHRISSIHSKQHVMLHSQHVSWTVEDPVGDPQCHTPGMKSWKCISGTPRSKQYWEKENEKWPYHSYQWLFFCVHVCYVRGKGSQPPRTGTDTWDEDCG